MRSTPMLGMETRTLEQFVKDSTTEYDRAVKMSESINKDVQDMGVQLLKKLMEGTGGDVSGSSSSSGSGSGSYGSVVEL